MWSRPYRRTPPLPRPARGIAAALEEIERGKGSRYDSAVVDACIRVLAEGFLNYERGLTRRKARQSATS